jgi:hypothetical protein
MKILLLVTVALSLSGMAHAKPAKARKPSSAIANATLDQAVAAARKHQGAIVGVNGQDNEYSTRLELSDGTALDVNPATFVQLIDSVCDLGGHFTIVGARVAFCTAR